DLRGHGATRLPNRIPGRRSWRDHRDDLIGLLDSIDGPPLVLAGHSMGGTAAALAAAERPDRVSRLVLMDPVIWTRLAVAAFQMPLLDRISSHIPMVRSTLRRRRLFDSREQAMAAYVGRGAFKGWPEIMVADYLADGLVQTDDGFTLACTPEWEASNYGAQSHNPWRALRRFGGPVQISRAETGSICHVPVRRWGLTNVSVEVVEGGGDVFPMATADVAR